MSQKGQEKQELSKGKEGTCRGTPGQIPTSEGSDPHPQTAGCWGSPPSHPGTRSSGQGPGIPTPQEWNLGTHPWSSTVPEMKTHSTNGPWGGFLVSHKMRRGERGKAQFTWSNILIDPLKAAWSQLLVSNLIYNFLFFPKIMISCNQHVFVMYVDIHERERFDSGRSHNTWKIYKFKPALGCLCRSVPFNTVSDTVSLSRWVTARLVSSETTKSTVTLKEHTLWRWWHHHTDDRCFSTSYTLSITLKTSYGWTCHQHNSILVKDLCPPYWGENSVTLRNCSDQTVKKWGNSTWAQVVGRDNWT